MKPGLYGVIFGVFFLVLNTIYYLRDPSSYFIPFTFAFLTVIITGMFEFKEYYNKTLYQVIVVVFLTLMWMVSFIHPLSFGVNIFLYYLEVGLMMILILLVIINSLRKWGKNEKVLELYDRALSQNPNDITTLNNKGVELALQKRYAKAMDYFDRVLEIDLKDAAAEHNKSFMEKYGTYHTLADYLEKDPKLEVTRKEGKYILGIKMK